jgi:hypothetical protein
MTRDPPIRLLLERYFGKKVTDEACCPPDYAVAIGAAVRGGMLKGLFPELCNKTEFVSGTAQDIASSGFLKRALSKIKGLKEGTSQTAFGIRWRGKALGLSDDQISYYAKELVEYEVKEKRMKVLKEADDAANDIVQRVNQDAAKRHDHHDKTIKTLVEQLKFWQYMVSSFRDHEVHLLRTVGELAKALDDLQGRTKDAELDGPTINFDKNAATPLQNVFKSTDPYTAAVIDREVREKRMMPVIDPEDDPTKAVIGGPKILRRKLPLPGADNDDKNNVQNAGHQSISVNVPESVRKSLLKNTVESNAWQEPPPPEGESTSWRAVKEGLSDETPVGSPVFASPTYMTLEEQLEWLLTNAAIDEPPSDVHRAKRDKAVILTSMSVQ